MNDFLFWFDVVVEVTIGLACFTFVFVWGKSGVKHARLRANAFRCIAAQVRRPSLAFRLSVAMVGIGCLHLAYYRVDGYESLELSRAIMLIGMIGTLAATVGMVVLRWMTRGFDPTSENMSLPPSASAKAERFDELVSYADVQGIDQLEA
jgi:hypothetical protein